MDIRADEDSDLTADGWTGVHFKLVSFLVGYHHHFSKLTLYGTPDTRTSFDFSTKAEQAFAIAP